MVQPVVIGVIAFQFAVFVDHGVHCANGSGPRVNFVQQWQHRLFIRYRDIDTAKLPLFKKRGKGFQLQFNQVIRVRRQLPMNEF